MINNKEELIQYLEFIEEKLPEKYDDYFSFVDEQRIHSEIKVMLVTSRDNLSEQILELCDNILYVFYSYKTKSLKFTLNKLLDELKNFKED